VVAALLATILGLVVFLWSRRLWGTAGGLLSLLLYTLCPTILAHAPLVNTDVPLALAATASIWTLRRFGDRPAGFAAAWLLAGAGLAIKFTGLVLLPLLVILLAFDGYRRRATPGALLLRLVAGGGLAFLVLAASYGFTGLHRYFDGLAVLKAHSEAGHASYFLGEVSTRGWLLYFPVAFLVKTPLPTLLILAMAALAGWGERRTPEGQATAWNEETVLWLSMPAAVFFFLPILGGLDIGVRYLIPSLPFLFVLAGRVARWSRPSPVVARALVVGLLVWLASVSFAAHPDYLPYFNEVAGGSEGGERFLADSNLDWGQDLPRLAEWFREEKPGGIYLAWFGSAPPAAYGIRYRWLPGKGAGFPLPIEPDIPPCKEYLVVSVHCLLGVPFPGSNPYAWLRGRQPSVQIAPSLRVYEISGGAAAHRSLAAVYDSVGHAEEARRERALAGAIEQSRSRPGP
jgi:4-amino-4-deoxy-L-arabinose transferase-like glycosyltransferase